MTKPPHATLLNCSVTKQLQHQVVGDSADCSEPGNEVADAYSPHGWQVTHLFHKKHIQSFWHRYLPPGYEPQQSGLALAIGPYQAIPPASCHTQLCVLQQQLTLGSHRQAVDLHNMQRTIVVAAVMKASGRARY